MPRNAGLAKLHRAIESFQAGLEIEPKDRQCLQGLQETQAAIHKNMTEGATEEQRQRALEVSVCNARSSYGKIPSLTKRASSLQSVGSGDPSDLLRPSRANDAGADG